MCAYFTSSNAAEILDRRLHISNTLRLLPAHEPDAALVFLIPSPAEQDSAWEIRVRPFCGEEEEVVSSSARHDFFWPIEADSCALQASPYLRADKQRKLKYNFVMNHAASREHSRNKLALWGHLRTSVAHNR